MFNSAPALFRLGKYPVTIVGLVILLEVLGMVLVVVTQTQIISAVGFSVEAFMQGQVWRMLSYPFFTPLSLNFLIGVVFFLQFGKVVEADLGRTAFIYLLGALLLLPPFLLVLCHMLGLNASYNLFGNHMLHLAVFSSFCVMYPNLPSFFGIPIKWFGLVFVSISILQPLQSGLTGLAVTILGTVLTSLWFVQYKGLSVINLFPQQKVRPRSKKRPKKIIKMPKKSSAPQSKLKPRAYIPSDTEIDAILDKISKNGIHSLTPEERETLQSKSK